MLAGVGAGLALALAAGRAVANAAYGMTPGDPLLLGLAVFALVATGLAAALIPVGRAVSVQPLVALRLD
jgi:putative ABC transport system permease protein